MLTYRKRNYAKRTNWSNSDNADSYERRSGYRHRQDFKKRSGCTTMKTEDGAIIVSGWKVSKGQLLSLYARPYKSKNSQTHVVESKSGKKWTNLFVTITNKTTMQVTNCSGLFDIDTKKLYIKQLNLIANPKGGRGGYFGKHISSSY